MRYAYDHGHQSCATQLKAAAFFFHPNSLPASLSAAPQKID
jgi:hypothetical protein